MSTGSAMRVMLVDDDEVDRLAVRRALSAHDERLQFIECSSAEEMFLALESGSFACVLLDYLLPGITARELLPLLRQRVGELPIIVLTAYGDEQVAVDLMKAGATDYFAKDRLDGRNLARSIGNAIARIGLQGA